MADILLFIKHKEKGILQFLSRSSARGANIHISYVFSFCYNFAFLGYKIMFRAEMWNLGFFSDQISTIYTNATIFSCLPLDFPVTEA